MKISFKQYNDTICSELYAVLLKILFNAFFAFLSSIMPKAHLQVLRVAFHERDALKKMLFLAYRDLSKK